MNSSDKLKRLGSGSGGYTFKNPYSKPAESVKPPAVPAERGMLDQNNHLLSKIIVLQKEMDQLRFDIVSILDIMADDTNSNMSIQVIRDKYFTWRASRDHVMNRIVNKSQESVKNNIKINE